MMTPASFVLTSARTVRGVLGSGGADVPPEPLLGEETPSASPGESLSRADAFALSLTLAVLSPTTPTLLAEAASTGVGEAKGAAVAILSEFRA